MARYKVEITLELGVNAKDRKEALKKVRGIISKAFRLIDFAGLHDFNWMLVKSKAKKLVF